MRDFHRVLKLLEKIADKAEKTDDWGERRKILPLQWELKYFDKLTAKIKILRGKLTERERRMWARIGRIERQNLRAYEEGLKSIR